jgi:hypothetical protein
MTKSPYTGKLTDVKRIAEQDTKSKTKYAQNLIIDHERFKIYHLENHISIGIGLEYQT